MLMIENNNMQNECLSDCGFESFQSSKISNIAFLSFSDKFIVLIFKDFLVAFYFGFD